MAKPFSHRIHVVPRPKNQPSNPPELDPSSIVDEVLTTVRECRVALSETEEYMSMIRGELASRLDHLELAALRAMAAKARRQ